MTLAKLPKFPGSALCHIGKDGIEFIELEVVSKTEIYNILWFNASLMDP